MKSLITILVSLILSANVFAQACDNFKTGQTYSVSKSCQVTLYGAQKGFEFTLAESQAFDSRTANVTYVVDIELQQVQGVACQSNKVECLDKLNNVISRRIDDIKMSITATDDESKNNIALLDCLKEIVRSYKITLSGK